VGLISSEFADAIVFSVLILVLLGRSYGILGRTEDGGCEVKGNLGWLILLLFIACFQSHWRISPYYNTVFDPRRHLCDSGRELDLLIGFAGQISVGHAAFYAMGAYTSGILTAKHSISPPLPSFVVFFVSGLVAWE